jgi:hypothetical protein
MNESSCLPPTTANGELLAAVLMSGHGKSAVHLADTVAA